MNISKSDFQTYRKCSSHFWIKKHRPELIANIKPNNFDKILSEQGYEVELLAQNLFQNGKDIPLKGKEGRELTKTLISNGHKLLYQASFAANGISARVDILEFTEEGWCIYEVKATSSKEKKKEDHYWDVGFQKEVLEACGLKVAKVFLVELNKSYIKNGELNLTELFQISDITQEIIDNNIEVKIEIGAAKKVLSSKEMPTSCQCYFKNRKNHCDSFTLFYKLPSYSIHDIARVRNNTLKKCFENGYENIDDILDLSYFSEIQRNQITVWQQKQSIEIIDEIQNELNKLIYPIYYLDYETYPAAIPIFDGSFPYHQVPFQFSLHVQYEQNGALEHYEFLHQENTSPFIPFINHLTKYIGSVGSIVVWNKSFESMINRNLSVIVQSSKMFLLDLNVRMFDLMDIFKKQYFVHRDFRGSTSIKKVLPVLCPELSYESLNIKDGGTASNAWRQLIFETNDNNEQKLIANDLLKYCELDTLAMVKIKEELEKLSNLT